MSLSNLIIESTAPLVLISIGIRMRNSNKIQNRRIQPAHRVDLGALYQCFVFYRFLSPFYLFLTEQCRDRKDLDLDPRIFILHFTGLRLYEIFFSLLSVQYTTTAPPPPPVCTTTTRAYSSSSSSSYYYYYYCCCCCCYYHYFYSAFIT